MCHVFNWKSDEEVILRVGAISMTCFQVKDAFQGGENALHLMRLFMECQKNDGSDKIFVPPFVEVKKILLC
jgi:hypothetical protein